MLLRKASILKRRGGGLADLQPLTRRWVQAMHVRPSQDRIAAMDTFVLQANAHGALDACDVLWIPCAHTEQAAYLNIMNPGQFSLVPQAPFDFIPDNGIAGDNANLFWKTGFVPIRDAKKTQLNSGEIFTFLTSNEYIPDQSSQCEFGGDYSVVKVLGTVLFTGSPNGAGGRINRNASSFGNANQVTTAIGLTSVSRGDVDGPGKTIIWKNGAAQVGGGANNAISLDTAEWFVGRANSATILSGSLRTIAAAGGGACFTGQQRIDLYNALCIYLSDVGAYDPSTADGPPYVPPTPDPFAPPVAKTAWTNEFQGRALDLTGYHQTFFEDFDDVSVITPDGGPGPWWAPIHSTSGAATFEPPNHSPSPFFVSDSILRIRCQFVNGEWETGHIQSVDSHGNGFSQTLGYWEWRTKFPPPGTWGEWPADWLYSTGVFTDPSQTTFECDVIEYYGGNDGKGHHSALHLRPGVPYRQGEVSQNWNTSDYTKLGPGTSLPDISDGQFHAHGVEYTPDWMIFYMDRIELKRFPMFKEANVPKYILLSNQLFGTEIPKVTGPIDMLIDSVTVWSK